MDEEKTVQEQTETQEQENPKRPRRGRKPMTQEQKDAMARGRAEKKKQAENMKPESTGKGSETLSWLRAPRTTISASSTRLMM